MGAVDRLLSSQTYVADTALIRGQVTRMQTGDAVKAFLSGRD